ncbi:MAG: hypothetical protein ACREID_05275, partial [Planctomycetota bacterium]
MWEWIFGALGAVVGAAGVVYVHRRRTAARHAGLSRRGDAVLFEAQAEAQRLVKAAEVQARDELVT